MWWLENYEEYVEHLQAFSLWWTGKYRSEYNAIMQLLRSDDAAKQAQAIAKGAAANHISITKCFDVC